MHCPRRGVTKHLRAWKVSALLTPVETWHYRYARRVYYPERAGRKKCSRRAAQNGGLAGVSTNELLRRAEMGMDVPISTVHAFLNILRGFVFWTY